MRITRSLTLGMAVLFALAAPIGAQDNKAPEKPAKPGAAPATPATPATPAVKMSASSQSGGTNSVAVSGLTKENSTTAKTALEGITHTAWRCPDCSMTQMEKGECPMCKKELVSEKTPALKSIMVDADKGTIGFAIAPGAMVRLSEIETALQAQKITVPRDKQTISPNSTLMVSGATSEDSVKKLEAELKSSKLFDSVSAKLVGTGKPAEVTVKGGTTPATRAKVEEAITKAGPDFKLVDIVWSSPVAMATPATPATPAAPKKG
jgi:hypothetical protein